jgi:plasmid stabilization system protein ParE
LSYSVHVRKTAERELVEAQMWYEAQQQGLAAQFHTEFIATVGTLAETPLIYPELYREVRRAVLRRFPYLVWYRVQDMDITVLACTHGKIDPSKLPVRLNRSKS